MKLPDRLFRLSRLTATLGLAAALSACASMPHKTAPVISTVPNPAVTTANPPEAPSAHQADTLLAEGHDLEAAKAYIQAAAAVQGQAQLHYLLKAAQASLQGNKSQVAVLLADEVLRLQQGDNTLRGEALWVRAQGLMDQGQTPRAKGNLEELLTIASTPQNVRAKAMGTLATLYTQEGHELTALNFLIERDSLLSGPAISKNHQRIHALLDSVSSARIQNWQGRSGNPLVQEWLAIALISRHNPDPEQRKAAINAWMAAHPGHPPINFSSHDELNVADTSQQPGGEICALLPSTGPYAELSQAISAGMETAAQLQAGPAVKLLQSTGNPSFTAVLFERGVREGCKIFVGPWLPQDINAVAGVRKPSEPPVIALGTDAGVQQPGLYVFSLSRDVAARQIADQGYGAGYRQVYVLYPQDSSGAAIQADFIQTWKKLGGNVAGVATYLPGHSLNGQAQQLLSGTSASHAFVFLVANADNAEAAVTAIRAINSSIPIFSPALLHGAALPADATDLSGIASVDMPWIVQPATTRPRAAALLHSTLPNASATQWRMAAFGLDAYALAESILAKKLRQPIEGATGTLHFGKAGRIVRDMDWMKIENGAIVPLSGIPKTGS
ncbi:penicillin-binding protein activator [Acidithiobacillus montserratensis]|uniref:Penicillin-binding protein activator n=1 Tax=Acidithiobacillus montserratensis TaxID=2729135 RepID=A0ACD5HH27_9PROT|nr:penicillin-binding protein activator [Acidithiobacillus montserratensis]MBN2679310.1 penicillin-binding protein activator [Acidithiobacillaceae bacterium]MBU2749055.1 ABC transporter substrate-binding protein [Acidithiobacillus montserratensis]